MTKIIGDEEKNSSSESAELRPTPGLSVALAENERRLLEKNAHIPSDEIEADIVMTEQEIAMMTREMEGLRMIGDRMSEYRADSRKRGIEDRKIFVGNLQNILRLRQIQRTSDTGDRSANA